MKCQAFLLVLVVSAKASFFGSSSPGNYSLLCDKASTFKCRCPEDDTTSDLDCSKGSIRDLPNDITFPDYIVKVNFGHNKLKTIPSTVFTHGIKVSHLDLSHNLITFIASNAFEGLDGIEHIDLSHNEVWSLSLDTFHGLMYLTSLNLAYNRVENFFPDAFKGCDKLQELNFRNNPMLFLEEGTFGFLAGLQNLDLSSTGLSALPDKLFATNTQLHTLQLSSNSFLSVPTKALSSAQALRKLEFSENPVETIKSNAFEGSSGLEILYFTHMRNLGTLDKYSLSGLDNLQELYITDNLRLVKISGKTFKKFQHTKAGEDLDSEEEETEARHPSLKKLVLRHNALQWLPQDLVDWKQLIELDLQENPWTCDCHLDWMASDDVPAGAKSSASCAWPQRLHGRTLSSLVSSDYTCSYMTAEATVALAVLVVAAFLLALAGVGFLMYRRSLVRCWCSRRGRGEEPKYTRVVSTKDRVDLEWDHTGEPAAKVA